MWRVMVANDGERPLEFRFADITNDQSVGGTPIYQTVASIRKR